MTTEAAETATEYDPLTPLYQGVVRAALACEKVIFDAIETLVESADWSAVYQAQFQMALLNDKIAQTVATLIPTEQVEATIAEVTKMAVEYGAAGDFYAGLSHDDLGGGGSGGVDPADIRMSSAVPDGQDADEVAAALKKAVEAAIPGAAVHTHVLRPGDPLPSPTRDSEEQEVIEAVQAALKEQFGVDAEIQSVGPNGEINGKISG